MSERYVQWAWKQITGGPIYKIALVTLAMEADEDGRGKIAWADLLKWTDLEMRQLKPALEALEGFGLVYLNLADAEISFRLRADQ